MTSFKPSSTLPIPNECHHSANCYNLTNGPTPGTLRPLNFPPIRLQQLQITPNSTQSSTAEMRARLRRNFNSHKNPAQLLLKAKPLKPLRNYNLIPPTVTQKALNRLDGCSARIHTIYSHPVIPGECNLMQLVCMRNFRGARETLISHLV